MLQQFDQLYAQFKEAGVDNEATFGGYRLVYINVPEEDRPRRKRCLPEATTWQTTRDSCVCVWQHPRHRAVPARRDRKPVEECQGGQGSPFGHCGSAHERYRDTSAH
jgi:hypothetical protein